MTIATWSALAGVLLPALVAVVNRKDWKPQIKAVVALGSSVVAGTVTVLLTGGFTGVNWVTAIGVVFAASQVSYLTWWKGSGIADYIEKNVNSGVDAAKEPPSITD